jgi:hypothetical protein
VTRSVIPGGETPSPLQRGLAVGALVVLGVLATAAVHELRAGARAIAASDAASTHGDSRAAIDAAHDAAEAAMPGSPYPEQGYARLAAIARAAEMQRDDATATAAWRATRAAALATNSMGSSSLAAAHLAEANDALAAIAWRTRTGAARTGDPDEYQRAIVVPLAFDDRPSSVTFLLLGVGAVVFLAAVIRLFGVRAPAKDRL